MIIIIIVTTTTTVSILATLYMILFHIRTHSSVYNIYYLVFSSKAHAVKKSFFRIEEHKMLQAKV